MLPGRVIFKPLDLFRYKNLFHTGICFVASSEGRVCPEWGDIWWLLNKWTHSGVMWPVNRSHKHSTRLTKVFTVESADASLSPYTKRVRSTSCCRRTQFQYFDRGQASLASSGAFCRGSGGVDIVATSHTLQSIERGRSASYCDNAQFWSCNREQVPLVLSRVLELGVFGPVCCFFPREREQTTYPETTARVDGGFLLLYEQRVLLGRREACLSKSLSLLNEPGILLLLNSVQYGMGCKPMETAAASQEEPAVQTLGLRLVVV